MIILYTDQQGGHWIPWNSPLTVTELQKTVAYAESGRRDFPAIFWDKGCNLFYPDGDTLPRFHSILLPTPARWDAFNCHWTFFVNDPIFQDWWAKYIASYSPNVSDEEREHRWRDQGPSAKWDDVVRYREESMQASRR